MLKARINYTILCVSSSNYLNTRTLTNLTSQSDKKVGQVKVQDQLVSMTQAEVQSLLNQAKITPITFSPEELNSFKSLVNGFFQAEGCIGGYFNNIKSRTVRPSWTIGQNASLETIQFFGLVMQVLKKANLTCSYRVLPSGIWFLTLRCTSWTELKETVFPYFDQLHGSKFAAIQKLLQIDKLRKDKSQQAQIQCIMLAYDLTESGTRKFSMTEKISACMSADNILLPELPITVAQPPQNITSINFCWIQGFFLGDGDMFIRIREVEGGIQFIPIFRLTQVRSSINLALFLIIQNYLKSIEITSYIKTQTANYELAVEGKIMCDRLIQHISFSTKNKFSFFKVSQIKVFTKVLYLLHLNIKNWIELQLAIVDLVYSIPHIREYDKSYWYKKIIEVHKLTIKDTFSIGAFIAPYKKDNRLIGWVVTIPKSLSIKPAAKYFVNLQDLEKAKLDAIAYRDNLLEKSLKDLLI